MLPEPSLRLLRLVRDHGPVQAADVGKTLGVDTSAAYRQLESLAARGLLDSEFVAEGPGRPRKLYRLSAAGYESFHEDHALLLRTVLDAVQARHGRRDLLATLRSIGKGLGAPLGEGTTTERVLALERLYDALGFEATFARRGDLVLVTQRNCPFLKVARADPAGLCECFDESIMRAALPKASVTLVESLALGAPRCRHEIRL